MRAPSLNLGTLVACALALAAPRSAVATYLLGAEINIDHLSGSEYEVLLTVWRDCNGIGGGPTEVVDLTGPCGSGTMTLTLLNGPTEVSLLCAAELANSTCNGGTLPGMERYIYSGQITLPPCDSWQFQWSQCCWASSMLTDPDPEMVVHATLDNSALVCLDGPRFEEHALPLLAGNDSLFIDALGVFDGPGLKRFALVDLLDEAGVPLGYNAPLSGEEPYPALVIDSLTGRMRAPSSGLYDVFAIGLELRITDSMNNTVATVERVFRLLTVQTVGDAAPTVFSGDVQLVSGTATLIDHRSVEVWPGNGFCLAASYWDPDGDPLDLASDIAQVLPGASVTTVPGNPATAVFCWTAPPGSSGTRHFSAHAFQEACPVRWQLGFLYNVTVLPDTADPCNSVGMSERPPVTMETLILAYDPTTHAVHWTLPGAEGSHPLIIRDVRGAVVFSGRTTAGDRGMVRLPASVSTGMHIVGLGGQYGRILVLR